MKKHYWSCRIKFAFAGLALVLAGIGSLNAQAEESFLSIKSEAGDYIGGGQTFKLTPANTVFNAMASEDKREVGISFTTSTWWNLNMVAPLGQQLVPGIYEGATRWPFQGPFEPGLDFSGDGRGCNELTGRFQVLEAIYGPFGYVERFHATFEQHCEGWTPALFGEIKIVNPPAPPLLTLGLTLNREGTVQRGNGAVSVSGTITCSATTTVQLSGTVTQRANRFAMSIGFFSASVPCSTTPATWSANASSNNGIPFNAGPAQVSVVGTATDPNFGNTVTEQVSGLANFTGGKKRK